MAYSREQLISKIYAAADAYGVDRAIAYAQLKRESADFRSDVVYGPFVAGAGERGVAQFTPGTWARFSNEPHTAAYDPDKSLRAWGAYMRLLLDMFGGRYDLALAVYNGGENRACLRAGSLSCAPAGAQRYAREVLAAAGKSPITTTTTSNDSGGGLSDWLQYWPYAAVGLVLIWFLSDD